MPPLCAFFSRPLFASPPQAAIFVHPFGGRAFSEISHRFCRKLHMGELLRTANQIGKLKPNGGKKGIRREMRLNGRPPSGIR
jgi:hypothetical protein